MSDRTTTAVWTPSPDVASATALARFAERVRATGVPIGGYEDLWRWSIAEPSAFWSLVWDTLAIVHSAAPTEIRGPRAMPGTRWFTGARLNLAENLLCPRVTSSPDAEILVARDETGRRVALTRVALAEQVGQLAAYLVGRGVRAGDRVAGFLPNREEAVIAMLAATRIGAVWSSCSPDFGFEGVMDRFGQITPVVLFACDGYPYGGRAFDTADRVQAIARAIPSITTVVGIDVLGEGIPGAVPFADALAIGAKSPAPPYAQLPFDHPVYILYSSGTTGAPKCIVHGAGGTLLQHGKELRLHSDVGPGDAISWFTTTGWMMWNWLVSALATGARVVLVDGSPAHPSVGALWRMAAEERLTHFGTSPKFLAACEKAELAPGAAFDLSALRALMSTGSPLAAEQFVWASQAVGRVQIASICGGTDILGCFMLGSPIDPVYPGEIQRRGLGMAVVALDELRGGAPPGRLVAAVGVKGELVCTEPFPSMPVGFWDDPDGKKYHDAYFSQCDGVWWHGDWIELTPRGGVIVYGRSDATLNPGGVRIGTAEIYAVVEAMPEIADSIVVSQDWDGDVRVVLFVVPAAGITVDDALLARIRSRIRTQCTPRHVPAKILVATDVPRTISGKKVELAVRRLLHHQPVTNRDALANPASLDQYAAHADGPELTSD